MLATVLHLHRGTPYVYQGEELGMTNAHFTSFDSYRDIESTRFVAESRESGQFSDPALLAALAASSRDNARTPMQWDDSPQAGFTTGEPWIEVNPNYKTINVAAQRFDPASVLSYYQRLIALRHDDPTVQLGDFTMLLPDHPHVYAFTRALADTRLLVLGNFSGDGQSVEAGPEWDGADVLIGNYPQPPIPSDRRLTLRPWEALVLRVKA
jgi:oligo-1,6-glucosidase